MTNGHAFAAGAPRRANRRDRGREKRPRDTGPIYVERAVSGFIGWLVTVAGQVGQTFDCPLLVPDDPRQSHEQTFTARATVSAEEVFLVFLRGEKLLSEIRLERRRLDRFHSVKIPSRSHGNVVCYRGAGARQISALLSLLTKKRHLQSVWYMIREGAFEIPRATVPARVGAGAAA